MNFLVVCRDEAYEFEGLLADAEVRSVPTSEAFSGRKLKASEICERAVIVFDDHLVESGWLGSSEYKRLIERQQAGEVALLAIRIGMAPCLVPDTLLMVEEADARTALRRFLADQPLQLPRPHTLPPTEEQQRWATAAARISLGGEAEAVLAELDLEPTLAVGHIVEGRFRLLRDLGPDPLFSNWFGHDIQGRTPVLYRVAHPHEKARAAQVEGLLPVWEGLDHPAVSKLVAHGHRGGSLWFANSVIGRALGDLVDQGQIEGDRILLAVLQVADALARAHAQQVVHGAVDPRRIYVDRAGNALLTDFGVAAVTKGSRDAVVYAAPETLAPDAKPDVSNDVYGLAMVLLLGLNNAPLPYWVMRDANRLVDDLELPEQLQSTLRACLDWSPERRPSSVDAITHAMLSDAPLALRLADAALTARQLDTVERIVTRLDEGGQVPAGVARLRMAVARVRASEGDPQTAIATLTDLAQTAPDGADIWLEIAEIQQKTDDTEGAIASCEAALDGHRNRRQATTALRMLLDLDPDRFARWGRTLALYTDGNEKGEVAFRLGKVFHDGGDDAAALLWLDRAADAGHETPELSRLRKQIRAARGDWNDVVDMLVTRAATAEDPVAALENAARIASRATPNPEPLTQIYSRMLELDHGHPEALRHLIRQASREGAIEESLRLLERLCETEAATAGDHAQRARKLLADNRWADALEAATEALALEPDHIVALRVAGRAAQDGGDFETALGHRRRLLQLQETPSGGVQADWLGRIADLLRFSGDSDGAAAHYERALKVAPNHLGAWWGLYLLERGALVEEGSIPQAPLRFGPHEGLARLLADLLEVDSIQRALSLDSFGRALSDPEAPLWVQAAQVVDLLAYREAIGPQLFDRLLDAFPQRISEISTVQSLFSGTANRSGVFPVNEALGWSHDGLDFGANLHRELLFCTTWPSESNILDPNLLDVLFHREGLLEPRDRAASDDEEEDLLLESPEVPVLVVGEDAGRRQVEIDGSMELTPATLPALPGVLGVHRHGDQIYLTVEDGALTLDDAIVDEVRLTGGDKLSWEGVPIEFYRVQDPSTLHTASMIGETTAPLPADHQPIPGIVEPVELAVLDPDEPALIWATDEGEVGVQIDSDQLMAVAKADGSLVFTTEDHDAYLAVIMNRGGDCYLEENLSHDSGFGGRLSARALIPGESLRIGAHSMVFRAPGKGLPSLNMPSPSLRDRRPYLLLMDGSQHGRPIAITATPFKLGRGRGCELQIRTDGLLSRVHCLLEARATGHTIRDAGSSNGTRLNGVPVGLEARPVKEGDRIQIGHTELVFTRSVMADELQHYDEVTDESTMDQDEMETRSYLHEDTVAFDDDSPEVQRKVSVANKALAVLAVALDAREGSGRTRAELQLLIDASPRAFQGIFDGIELTTHAIPWDTVDDTLADRPERRRRQALASGLIALVDRATDRVCELIDDEKHIESMLADLAQLHHRRELQF